MIEHVQKQNYTLQAKGYAHHTRNYEKARVSGSQYFTGIACVHINIRTANSEVKHPYFEKLKKHCQLFILLKFPLNSLYRKSNVA